MSFSHRTPLLDEATLRVTFLKVNLRGASIPVDVRISNSCATIADFSFRGQPYTFVITKWSKRGIATLITMFHDTGTHRPQEKFGSIDDEGAPVNLTLERKVNMVLQAVRDIFTCIDAILTKHNGGILAYAVWYLERLDEANYSSYITSLACQCIVRTHFMCPEVAWERVEFDVADTVPINAI